MPPTQTRLVPSFNGRQMCFRGGGFFAFGFGFGFGAFGFTFTGGLAAGGDAVATITVTVTGGGATVDGGAQSPFTVTAARNDVSPRVTVTLTEPVVVPAIVAGVTLSAANPSIVPLVR